MADLKAEFRILRQLSGITAQELADSYDVNLRSVQRWETDNNPPLEVINTLRDIVDDDTLYIEEALEGLENIIDEVKESVANAGDPKAIRLPHYRTKDVYEKQPKVLDTLPWGRFCARVQRLASTLLIEGYEVEFDYYPEHDEI